MAVVTKPPVLDETGQRIADALEIIAGSPKTKIIYGIRINNAESSPSNKITYLKDAVGMIPAHMNYISGQFDYGSWEDAFFMPRPCMLNSDGSVAYYLNPNDYTKKVDGTASDVANTSFNGNAMMEWGRDGKKIWTKIEPSNYGKSCNIYVANYQVDSDYRDWPFHNKNGTSVDHFYTPIYNGSVISNKMRSISGQQVSSLLDAATERTRAQANGAIWDVETKADIDLINILLMLISRTTDSQTAFGQGATTGGNETVNPTFRTGVHNTKGLFYGTTDGTVAANSFNNCVKVFGMENWYGFQWRRYIGHIIDNGVHKVKLTYGTEDGSTTTGYNLTGSGYKSQGVGPSGTSGGYISEYTFTEDGMFVSNASGANTTYYCDGCWFDNAVVSVPFRGANSCGGALCGSLAFDSNVAASGSGWSVGASLSCKPLA